MKSPTKQTLKALVDHLEVDGKWLPFVEYFEFERQMVLDDLLSGNFDSDKDIIEARVKIDIWNDLINFQATREQSR